MSGRMRWMTSATAAAWTSPGVERSATSSPSAARFSEALNVATRNVPDPAEPVSGGQVIGAGVSTPGGRDATAGSVVSSEEVVVSATTVRPVVVVSPTVVVVSVTTAGFESVIDVTTPTAPIVETA